ncbi:MAG: NAD(+) synthase, partial [Bacteroidota bacterium]
TAEIHDALVLGIRDYVRKTGDGVFPKALVGLSGGIDSAVTCALAVEALGPDRVVGITMPSAYSSSGSVTDSEALAENLGIDLHEVSIRPAVDAFEAMLAPLFAGTDPSTLDGGVAEENVQSRSRGLTLMAVSNKFGYLLLTTGNKSEMAVGYATLYGDMSGGLAVLSDVFKLEVYRLAEHINARAGRDVIPRSTITKPPSAELKPGQVDADSLPPYDVLDRILEGYIEDHLDADAIVRETGHDRALVERIVRMVDRNEYKRRQAAPGLRVSGKAFGVGRRLPIVMQRTRVPEAVEA